MLIDLVEDIFKEPSTNMIIVICVPVWLFQIVNLLCLRHHVGLVIGRLFRKAFGVSRMMFSDFTHPNVLWGSVGKCDMSPDICVDWW